MSQSDNPITYKVFNVDLKDIVISNNDQFRGQFFEHIFLGDE